MSNSDESSDRLSLVQLISRADIWIKKKLLLALEGSDFDGLNNSDLLMLANLDCGRTYPSEVARRIGVSRQAVYKLLKNLESKGFVTLELDIERRNSKVIVITIEGEKLIGEALGILKEIEVELGESIGVKSVSDLRSVLELDWGDV